MSHVHQWSYLCSVVVIMMLTQTWKWVGEHTSHVRVKGYDVPFIYFLYVGLQYSIRHIGSWNCQKFNTSKYIQIPIVYTKAFGHGCQMTMVPCFLDESVWKSLEYSPKYSQGHKPMVYKYDFPLHIPPCLLSRVPSWESSTTSTIIIQICHMGFHA